MKKNRLLKFLASVAVLSGLLSFTSHEASAQAVGSSFSDNSTNAVAAGTTTLIYSESAYFGPDSKWTIDGTLEVYSKNVWIAPTATFTGSGKIVFINPVTVGGAASPSLVDGNNNTNFIDVNIEHRNAENVILTDIADPIFGTVNPSGVLAAALNVGKDFNMTADNGDVILNGNNFAFDTDATISGYRPERKVVTSNAITGHMVKNGITSAFVFPLGINETDYNPAEITAASGNIFASLQDRTASASNETLIAKGIDRTWHIYADADVAATVNLQHDVATEISGFSSTGKHYVTRFLGSSWETNAGAVGAAGTLTTGTSPVPNSSMRSLSTTIIGLTSDNRTYFTKAPLLQDLRPTLTVLPASFTGSTPIPISLRFRIIEINDVPTDGTVITARLKTGSDYTLNVTPGSVVSGWTYTGVVGVNHVFTSNMILQNSASQMNLPATFNLVGATGNYIFTVAIATGSGGEKNTSNNSDQDKVSFNP